MGTGFVFLRIDGAPAPVGNPGSAHFGHVGWGFELLGGRCGFGATENGSGSGFVPPGGDNGAWSDQGDAAAMYAAMRARGYDLVKVVPVARPNPVAALEKGEEMKRLGYRFIGSNCADHTYWVLEAYGAQGLPLLQMHPAPNDWFGEVNGEARRL